MKGREALGLLAIIVVASVLLSSAAPALSATAPNFASASSSISSAYVAVSRAQSQGGNVTGLVASLNSALALYSKAVQENQTDPAAASADLQSATLTANQVSAAAPGVGQEGAAARLAQEELSVGGAVAIIVLAGVIYLFGDRIYHRAWLRLHSGYMVKKVG